MTNVIQHKSQKNVFVFVGSDNVSFRSSDCLGQISLFTHKKGLHKVSFHPLDYKKILLLVVKKRKCLTPLCLPNRNLYLTEDFLKTIKRVAKNVLDYNWAFNQETADKGFPKNRVIILKQVEGKSTRVTPI